MSTRDGSGGLSNGKFFRTHLIYNESINELHREAFILVYKIGFTMDDVRKMTLKERYDFFEFLREDIEEKNDSIKRNRVR